MVGTLKDARFILKYFLKKKNNLQKFSLSKSVKMTKAGGDT